MTTSSLEQSQTLRASPHPLLEGIVERREPDAVILSPSDKRPFRRVIYLDNYGGPSFWEQIKAGLVSPHHLRGCLELAKMGYEVALVEPLPDFYLRRNPLPHDLRLVGRIRNWLGKDGIIFCGHNVLYWSLFLKKLGLVRCNIVSHLWAREPLNFAREHTGIIALTPAGADQARRLAPNVKVAHLSWGVHLPSHPLLPYRPESFFSCGATRRDFKTLSEGVARCNQPVTVLLPGEKEKLNWPQNATVIDTGRNTQSRKISFSELLHKFYANSAGSLIILKKDPTVETAVGCTEIIEVMAMARPIILTRAGGMATEIDVEKAGWGIHVAPEDPGALGEAIEFLAADRKRAEAMGQKGRQLAESYYNIDRYARDLHKFFESF